MVRFVAVIDIGKTNAKLALVNLETRSEIAAMRRPNRVLRDGPYPHHDVESLWRFILEGLAEIGRGHAIDAISVTTHGATAVLIDRAGGLALPVLDYEFDGPDMTRSEYEKVRPPYAETGSPALPIGLNLGAQLFWQSRAFPQAFANTGAILMYPQYWSWRLCGQMAGELTSLGCHTDLWNPYAGDYSALVDTMDWRQLFPTVRPASAVLGAVLPSVAVRTGLDPTTLVVSGIHDSNASLLPHLIDRRPPFAVVSTGTWVVAMAVGGRKTELDPARDTLVNVNAFGAAVPSARFMGGREFELLQAGGVGVAVPGDIDEILSSGTMLLPAIVAGSGPFPRAAAQWLGAEPSGGPRFAAASFYLALMTATCLDLIGADGETIIEGPFAGNEAYLAMLAAATGRAVIVSDSGTTGTSIGAALLLGQRRTRSVTKPRDRPPVRPDHSNYATAWYAKVAAAN